MAELENPCCTPAAPQGGVSALAAALDPVAI